MRVLRMPNNPKLKLLLILFLIGMTAGCSRPRRIAIATPARQVGELPAAYAESPTLRGVNNLVCSNCHNAMTVDVGGQKYAISFSHVKHQKRGVHCDYCHPSVAHGGLISPSHPQCFSCHNGKTAPKDCGLCHLRRSDINPHPKNWISIHGHEPLPSTCNECHTHAFCLNCHTLEMPHPKNWISIHGRNIANGDCARCHTQGYCSQCHERTRPANHMRKDWLAAHGSASQAIDRNCGVCHTDRFCLNCHGLQMPHPSNWTSAHVGPGRTKTSVCFKCHKINECRTCHTSLKILGHPAQFITTHPQSASGPNPICQVCHTPAFCKTCHPSGIDGRIFPGG